MQFIDTHCHLFLKEFDADRDEIIQKAKEVGITHLLLPNVDSSTLSALKETCVIYRDYCIPLIGLHPTSVKDNYREELDIVKHELITNTYFGIGEIGIDLYWDKSTLAQQIEAFIFQLELASQNKLPVIIHVRNSFDETFNAIEQCGIKNLNGIFHCFSGNLQQARKVIELGFLLGIGGVVTFKNSGLDSVIPHIDLKHIVLETDSPYLAPVPHRGKRNEPSYVPLIAQKIAELKQITIAEVAQKTTTNAKVLFKLT